MSHPLTIEIPDAVFAYLQQRAKQLGKTPEVVAAQCIEVSVVPPEDDPLLKWMGAFSSGPGDAAERHDYYIGDALAKEMRGETNE
ncbi:MAG: hypothetical protein HYR84_02235 [Planctomycetes bacterium]|nr:hypothetical protein [Planctomycetota bacterium]